ncbi:MAG: rod shape-determining protein [Candidatus Harrisonbacteria bacterium CG10_big_fil_rev_8_21_14_0_10_40_38]|uniref:Cell shape-determining protein MreB n=1 Tax=Candidatus Harrisonbacteria bacterium CG10_big_fil_rev_8_21_14_0_10_40_38 TaxID=1974583 RepID=A0A2H0US81_9BACT|nr:MAG: rod shape-determining protein [Candidatus Harrisonbacteria bacterium CG10_big_fil_rev_8_21_14_0_10_40_38]
MPFFSRNIGVDLGTSNILIYLDKRGIVINEPSIVAFNTKTGKLLAVGEEAKKMLGRTPAHIQVIRPLVNGVISDFEMSQEILRHFLRKLAKQGSFMSYGKAIVGVPSNLTEVERKSVEDAVMGAGVFQPYVIDEPLAAAIGARLPIDEAIASMIVDIGGGTTEIAIISMAGTVTSKSLKVAGDKLTDDILRFVREEFKLAVGEATAEEIKLAIGSAIPLDQKLEMNIRGRDMVSGLPKEIVIRDTQVRAAIAKSLRSIVEAIREVLEIAPPELAGDILKRGINICGGGSLLRGIDQLISKELSVATMVIEDPLTCVARGTGVVIENLTHYENLLDNPLRPKEIKL